MFQMCDGNKLTPDAEPVQYHKLLMTWYEASQAHCFSYVQREVFFHFCCFGEYNRSLNTCRMDKIIINVNINPLALICYCMRSLDGHCRNSVSTAF